jgi:RimJ/RimL family protein N-acetyltransferase
MLEQIAVFRHLGTLSDGTRVLLRPLMKEDREKLRAFFAPTSPEDLQYFRSDVTNPAVINGWIDNLDYAKVLPIVAIVNDRIVGQATLHFGAGPYRHMAEVRIFLCKEFRRRGLGTLVLRTLSELARKMGLQRLMAQVVADQRQVIKAFQSQGYTLEATLPDHFMMPDGETRDIVILIQRLTPQREEF